MIVKTYGINGLSEWHGDIKAGSISAKVSFTGGTASPSGAQPAYFVTRDPVTQFIIENSKEFKSGFIHIEMAQDVPGEHPRMATPKPQPSSPGPDEAEDAPKVNDSVAFSNSEDAKDYFAERYGVSRSKLRTRAAIEEEAKRLGVKIEWEPEKV